MTTKVLSKARAGAALLAVGALALSACSSSSGGSSSNSAGTIKIGVATALTGPTASDTIQRSIDYVIKQINDKGGINGRKIETVVEDVGATAATGTAAARKFIQDKVVMVIGYSTTTQNLAVSPLFKAAKIPTLNGTASTANNYDKTGNKYNFIFNVPDDETANHQVKYSLETLKAKKIALLLDSTAFGKTYGELVTPLITAGGATVSETQYVNPDANDESTQISKILASSPDELMAALLTAPTVTLMYNELKKQAGQTPPALMVAAAVVAQLGKGVPWATAQGTYGTFMTEGMYDAAARPKSMDDWYAEVEKGSTPPSDTAAEMHDAMLAYASAVEATGGTDPDKIVDNLTALKDFKGWNGIDAITGPYTCNATTHQCLHAQYMGQVRNDALVEVAHYTE
jgi:branched-chain amino acid transport system substrate-binding protein